jgi:hypothetical protein
MTASASCSTSAWGQGGTLAVAISACGGRTLGGIEVDKVSACSRLEKHSKVTPSSNATLYFP